MADKDQSGTSGSGWKITAFIAIGLLVLGIVYFSLKSGLFVQKLAVPGMVELQFAERTGLGSAGKPEQANDPELKANQAQLEQKLGELERRLAER